MGSKSLIFSRQKKRNFRGVGLKFRGLGRWLEGFEFTGVERFRGLEFTGVYWFRGLGVLGVYWVWYRHSASQLRTQN